MASDRYFENVFKEFSSDCTNIDVNGKLSPETTQKLKDLLNDLLKTISSSDIINEKHDVSIYTGRCGLALLYFHLHKQLDKDTYLKEALLHVEFCKRKLKGRRVTFLCGDSGILAMTAVIYNELIDHKHKAQKYVNKLLSLVSEVTDITSPLPDEMLYGRSGYLYSLLFVNKHMNNCISQEKIVEVWKKILESGIQNAKTFSETPLMYEWHGKRYIGAAHGLIGILYILLQVDSSETRSFIHSHVLPTIDFILNLQFPSGNFPSSLGNEKDRLIHWCHGAPGAIHLMLAAHRAFKDEKYLKSAEKCCNVIWQRGLLKKGYGICHGPAGNAYAFLAMYQYTNDSKFLYKAVQFALWCWDYKTRTGLAVPDRPFSLFEGLSGTAYFIVDVLNPKQANFPAFNL